MAVIVYQVALPSCAVKILTRNQILCCWIHPKCLRVACPGVSLISLPRRTFPHEATIEVAKLYIFDAPNILGLAASMDRRIWSPSWMVEVPLDVPLHLRMDMDGPMDGGEEAIESEASVLEDAIRGPPVLWESPPSVLHNRSPWGDILLRVWPFFW